MLVYTSDAKGSLVSMELSFHQWAIVSGGTMEQGLVMDVFDLAFTLVDYDRTSEDGLELPIRLLEMKFNKSLKELRWTL